LHVHSFSILFYVLRLGALEAANGVPFHLFSVGFTFVKDVVMFFPVIFSSICNFEVTHIQVHVISVCNHYLAALPKARRSEKRFKD
jgi:hypothetical protein